MALGLCVKAWPERLFYGVNSPAPNKIRIFLENCKKSVFFYYLCRRVTIPLV